MATRLSDADLLNELEPMAEQYLNRHMKVVEMWYPHDYVPYGDGRDFEAEPWTPDQPSLDGVARTAFFMNLMTEDNLPSYHREIYSMFGKKDTAWMSWVHRWTAEEGRHSIVLRDYLMLTRNEDPKKLEDGRMGAMEVGYDADGKNTLRGIAYVSFQELATRISHRNTGKYSGDPVADRIMERISKDENLHMLFYRDMMDAAKHVDPNGVVEAVAAEVMGFSMPGDGIPNFNRMAAQIALAGIYDLRVHHDDVVWPILRKWGIFEMEGLDSAAEQRREELAQFIENLDAQATRFEERREKKRQRAESRDRKLVS
ncbi:acyl-ACP desaturase [Euzebya tangerina]|uniref:acyl-ACP desaturase n=1 Tax=Euzebya tangerina TaxID=591198 RepID=UPI000E323BF5|nr:acyl-ACP desaturase [Euzebya tangerina]